MYTVREAAWMLQLGEAKLRRWLFASGDARLLHGIRDGKLCALDFALLVESMVVGQLRQSGYSLQEIRRARTTLASLSGSDHPFAHQRMVTDCKTKRLYWLDEDANLTDLHTRQMAFIKILEPYLQRLEFDPTTGLATRWLIGDGVIVDPRVGYGAPVIAGTRVSADLVAEMVERSGDAKVAAEWFGISEHQVDCAVQLVRRLGSPGRRRSAA